MYSQIKTIKARSYFPENTGHVPDKKWIEKKKVGFVTM